MVTNYQQSQSLICFQSDTILYILWHHQVRHLYGVKITRFQLISGPTPHTTISKKQLIIKYNENMANTPKNFQPD